MDGLATDRKITLLETGDVILPPETRGTAGTCRYALLIFCDGDAQLSPLEDGSAVVVGRQQPAEVLVNDPSVSRQHARFVREGDTVWVEDLDSRHGTLLRGQSVKRERLAAFDEVRLGRARIVVAATAAASAPVAATTGTFDPELVLVDPQMKRVYETAARAARGRLPVLVLGETGTGKEHVVSAVHSASERRAKPLVAVNCAAIAPSLLESTLFGHERGAFTGAAQRSIGVFERASGGVLFLDEVGDLTTSAQVALLRALETQKVTRVGSSLEIDVDVHVIAATHCDLESMVADGTFRRDLYFRLNGVQIRLPPLRERTAEIEPLARHFLRCAAREWSLPLRDLSAAALEALRRYSWPGNVRQLRYALERAALLANNQSIQPEDLPEYVGSEAMGIATQPPAFGPDLALKQQLKQYERMLIDEALRRAGGNRQAAAKLLRIPLRTFFRKLRGTPPEAELG